MNALGSFADWVSDVFMMSLKKIGAFFATLASNPKIFFGLGGKGSLGKAMKINIMKDMAEEQILSGAIKKEDYAKDKTILGKIIRKEDITDEDIESQTDVILTKMLTFFQDQAKKEPTQGVSSAIKPSNADGK